jgi:hypothetical protein
VTAVADAGAGATGMTWARQLRSELRRSLPFGSQTCGLRLINPV